MSLKNCLSILFFLITISTHAQNNWIETIKGRLSVTFPQKPNLFDTALIATDDDGLNYGLDEVSLLQPGIDSLAVEDLKKSDLFAENLQMVFETTWGEEFNYPEESTWNGFKCYKTVNTVQTDKSIYIYVIVIGSSTYNLYVLVPAGQTAEGRDTFFSSIKLVKE